MTCEGQTAYVLSYGKLGDDPGVSINSTQVYFPDELIKSANDVVLDLTGEDITTNSNSNGAANGTPTTNATCEEQVPQDGTGQRLSGQKRKAQALGTRTPPPRQRRSPTPPERCIQRTHTPPERRNQTTSRTLETIRKRPTPIKLVRKYSKELWNKWKADYEPNRTHTQHLETFCKYVVYKMIRGQIRKQARDTLRTTVPISGSLRDCDLRGQHQKDQTKVDWPLQILERTTRKIHVHPQCCGSHSPILGMHST